MSAEDIARARALDKLNAVFPPLRAGDGSAAEAAAEAGRALGTREEHSQAWEALWADASFLPWERGAPHPALHDALAKRGDLLGDAVRAPGEAAARAARRTALVPGCGRGYDVFLLRSFGFDALGLDVSETAAAGATQVDRMIRDGAGPGEGKVEGVGYAVKDEGIGEGDARIVVGDFFALQGEFDLIFDYTFLSALPPSMRPQWAATFSRLLAPSGRLVCAEFPTQKPTDSGGPPWALPEDVYVSHLHQPGVAVRYDAQGKVVPEDATRPLAKGGLERIARWQPERTHEAGKGTDMISVWRHAPSVEPL